jgi:iron complex outermembrane receptor protein
MATQEALACLAACSLILSLGAGLVSPAAAQTMDYESLEQMLGEPVTTSATGLPQRVSDVAANMEIVSADDIRRSGAIDLPGVLRHVTGVDVLRWGASSADIGIRGYNGPYSPRLLVLLNGRQVYLDQYGMTSWNAIPVELAEIRQIEIVKGPNTALYGFNATGGVINIVTYNPLYDKVNSATLTLGTQNSAQGSVVATGQVADRMAIRLSAGGFHTDEFAAVRDLARQAGLSQHDERVSVAADAYIRLGDGSQIELEATHVTLHDIEVPPLWLPSYAKWDVSSLKGGYTANTGIGMLQVTAYTNRAVWNGNLLGLDRVKAANQLTMAQVQDTFKLGPDHSIRLSAEYRHSALNTSPVSGGAVAYDIGSASGAWSWTPLPPLTLTQAVRVDALKLSRSGSFAGFPFDNRAWNRTLVEPSFNSGVVYKASPVDTFRLTVARGVQLPSLLAFGGLQALEGPFAFVGSPTISPTITMNYELDWDHQFPEFGARTRLAAFYQTNTGLQSLFVPPSVYFPQPGVLTSIARNIGNSQELGLELSVKGTVGEHWRWSLGYSPRIVHDDIPAAFPFTQTGVSYQRTAPKHVLDASVGYSIGSWEADAFAHYESAFYGLVSTGGFNYAQSRVSDYVAIDGRVGYHLTKDVTLAISGQNLGLRTQRQTTIGTVDRRLFATVSVRF